MRLQKMHDYDNLMNEQEEHATHKLKANKSYETKQIFSINYRLKIQKEQ